MGGLDLSTAERLVEAAVAHARTLDVQISAAVVDAGGHLVAFARMDGAEVAGPTLAVDKAYTAVAQSTPTDELAVLCAPGGPLFGLQANGGGRYVIFGGGIPLRENGADGGRIVGGVGVSGAAVEDDTACARAAVAAFARSPTGVPLS
ncbi:hypothetical protein LK09_00915 [Microbacterium mangrovi]|uniref:Heme-binding protein n=1 Tax=Microbacterium mangrovi TaxID=1348253 RepID=A0A0B2A8P6_9MICO|nr:heme-binding protein [Microbacterium mangrovi]KHK99923.1 hypothetical protein LK09_00915 [Microbacterium mangrovi]